MRKNRRRFKPELAHSILYHSLPDEKMEFYYRTNDWEKLVAGNPTHLRVRRIGGAEEIGLPYAVFPNEPEVTLDPATLGTTLERTLARLWVTLGNC